MKYITFKELYIKNFLSVGEEPVKVNFNTGLNIITGINKDKEDRRNGVGKSTVADAIYFAVFGNTIRELKKEHITNNITQSKCEVVLDFEISHNGQTQLYKIVRTLGPTKCYLYVDGNDKTRDSIGNTNELISEIINSSPEVFQNCVIMTINNTTPFMAKKKIEKRKFIEGIFNLQVFSSMLNTVRSESNELLKDFNVECARYEEISNSLESYNNQQAELQSQRDQTKATLNNRKQLNLDKIKECNVKLGNIKQIDRDSTESKVTKLNQAQQKVSQLVQDHQTKVIEISTTINLLTEKLNKVGTKESICPTCLRPLDKNDVSHIEQEKAEMNIKLDELREQKQTTDKSKFSHESKYSDISTAIKKLESLLYKDGLNQQELVNLKKEIYSLEELNQQIKDDIKQLKSDDTGLEETIKATSTKLENVQTLIDDFKKQINVYEVIRFIVSEEGVKSYIVKKILQLFNSKLAYYLKKMDANCICVFNEYFEEQIIDEKGKICSYFNFSGAERKNIDLACLFTFMDIRRLQGDVAFNFSIYDELFDSSLDERGVELVTDILKERIEKYKECIMVISHRKESVKSATGEIIFLEKKNGITTRLDNPVFSS